MINMCIFTIEKSTLSLAFEFLSQKEIDVKKYQKRRMPLNKKRNLILTEKQRTKKMKCEDLPFISQHRKKNQRRSKAIRTTGQSGILINPYQKA